MRVKLEYYIILTIDTYERCLKLRDIKPDTVRYPSFRVTEDVPEDSCIKKHRKYVGIISPEDLKKLIYESNFDDTCDTMGSITLDYGWMPAISFNANGERYSINAYVTPIPSRSVEEKLIEEAEKHPQTDLIKKKIGRKLEQCLDVLKEALKFTAVPKSFYVDLDQLCFEFN